MNLWDHAKQLADAVSETNQQIGSQIDKAAAATKQATEELATTSVQALQQAQQVAQKAVEQGAAELDSALGYVKTVGEGAQQTAQTLTVTSLATLHELQETGQQHSQRSLEAMGKALEEWQGTIAALGTSGMVTANALQDLPRTAQELAQEMPALARRLQRAGTRLGDAPRSDADMMGLFDKIPGTSKLGASERDIRVFLSDKHGSHVQAHSKGGSNGAENIVWELGADNIRRGAATMTGGEQTYIRFYNAVDSVLKNSTTIAQLGLAATGTAILAQALVTALAYTLDLYRGDITADEFRDKIVAAAISAGIATPIFFLILVAVMALFPEIVVVLSAPAVILGFNALFGVGVALPIVQSIVRHVEAGGCGDEAKAQYAKAIAQGNALLETSSLEVQRWWQQLFAADPVLENEAIAET
ncbi:MULTISPECIES: hypothetical protein [Cyanophyceae]|uniref:hypothetical protein n=1 Tax=Cyanophyceae TaxID=3028117 RepID=UPI0018F00E1E|nr:MULTISPECIES: hypothetical protein [Cyanophyceae]